MRLDFNVLWVEDQREQVKAQMDRITLLLRKEGFRLQAQFAESVDAAAGFLASDVFGDHIDLVLMDYDLGPGKSGDEGLEVVRHEFPYKDIVFYSGQKTADLAKMVTDKHVQGIYICHRTDLPDTVHGVFENLVRKVLDIDHSRGIVMGATSDIDAQIILLLCSGFNACNNMTKESLLSYLETRLNRKEKDIGKKIKKIRSIKHPEELLPHHSIITSDDRFQLLRKLFELQNIHVEKSELFDEYRDMVVPKRNDFAHVTAKVDGFSRRLFDRNGKEITTDELNTLRLKLLEFHEELAGLLQ